MCLMEVSQTRHSRTRRLLYVWRDRFDEFLVATLPRHFEHGCGVETHWSPRCPFPAGLLRAVAKTGQAVRQLGFPDTTVLSTPVGVYVADKV